MRRESLFLRFFLVACATGVAIGVATWFIVKQEAGSILFLALGAGILAAILFLFLSCLLMRRYIQTPLRKLVAYARGILEGRNDAVPETGQGEIRELSEAFRRMTEAIRDREKSLTDLAKFTASNPNLVMKVDPEGRILYANRGVERALYEMGIPLQHSELLLPDDTGEIVREVLASEQKKRGLTCETEGRTIEYTVSGFEDEEAVVFHGVDVTEKRALEEELLHSRTMETLGRIAGGIAHDINHLLAGILGHASLLKSVPSEDPRIGKAVERIENAAERGAQLTRQLLGFARKGPLEHLPVDLNRLVEETSDLASRTFPEHVAVIQEKADDLPPVVGDATQLGQCLMNLCINARDAMPGGGTITFSTRKTLRQEEVRERDYRIPAGLYATVIVTDQGEGMNEATLQRIFDPFFMTREWRKGTGLGMSLVYGTVKNHGGFITVDSAPGKGTSIRIDLPTREEKIPAPDPAEPPPRRESFARRIGTVLLVDDEELVRDVAGAMLASLGFEVLTAPDGKEGVEIFRREKARISFTVLDLRMPVMDGTRAFEEIRKIDPAAKVVISTGFSGDEDVDRLKEKGAAAVLSKPYTYGKIARVTELLRVPFLSPHPVQEP